MSSDYKKDTAVDKFKLEEEVLRQGQLFTDWSDEFGAARKERILAEERLKVVRAEAKTAIDKKKAEVDNHIRTNYDMYGYDKKPTESAISGLIITHDDVINIEGDQAELILRAVEEYAEAVEDETIMEGAKTGMSHKKSMLELEMGAIQSGMFGEPKIPKDIKEDIQSKDDKVTRDKGRNKLNRKIKGD